MAKLQACTGTLMFLIGVSLLAMNEHAAVRSWIKHGEGLGQVVELASAPDTSARDFIGKLIHASCTAVPDFVRDEHQPESDAGTSTNADASDASSSFIADTDTGIRVPHDTFMLRRKVEMLQWVETRSTSRGDGSAEGDPEGSDGFEYRLEWLAQPIVSKHFHDRSKQNPSFPIESYTFLPTNGVKLYPHGKVFSLSLSISRILLQDFLSSSRELEHFLISELPVGDENAVKGDARGSNILSGGGGKTGISSVKKKVLSRADLKLGSDGILYTGEGSMVGDLRISYDIARENTNFLSVIGGVKDEKGTIDYYKLPSGKRVLMIELGKRSAASMVRRSDLENGLRLSATRVAAFLLMLIGQILLYSSTLVDDLFMACQLRPSNDPTRFSCAASIITSCAVSGLLWASASLTEGLPLLIAVPVCSFVFRMYHSARMHQMQLYSKLPLQDDADDVEFPADTC